MGGHGHHHGPAMSSQKLEPRSYPELNYSSGAKWIKNLTKDRLNNFEGGHYSDVNISSVLFVHRMYNENNIKLQVWSAPGLTKPSFEEAMKQKFKPAKKGDSFGPSCKFFSLLRSNFTYNLCRGE
jgi:alpha-mannosidase